MVDIKEPRKKSGEGFSDGEMDKFKERLSSRITNEVRGVNRVLYTEAVKR